MVTQKPTPGVRVGTFAALLRQCRALRRTVDVVRDVLDRTSPGRAVADFGADLDAREPEIFVAPET